MAQKSSASSRPEKLVSVNAGDILNKPPTKRQRAMLSRLAKLPDSEIDYSDIPPLNDARKSLSDNIKRKEPSGNSSKSKRS
jgi:hypothetical protein